jgi:hypothetical protein
MKYFADLIPEKIKQATARRGLLPSAGRRVNRKDVRKARGLEVNLLSGMNASTSNKPIRPYCFFTDTSSAYR